MPEERPTNVFVEWFKRNYWYDKPPEKFPKCPFCGHPDRDFIMVQMPRLVNSRFSFGSRIRVNLRCANCEFLMTATRVYGTKKWSYFESM